MLKNVSYKEVLIADLKLTSITRLSDYHGFTDSSQPFLV